MMPLCTAGTLHPDPFAISAAKMATFSSKVTGQVWSLAQDAKGSRAVQQALEDAESESVRGSIARELRGHILDAMQCPHANHVLQKCASILEASSLQFVIDEIAREDAQTICKLAQHRYA